MDINYSTSMFIGETTQGVAQPVFFDTHTAIFNNQPPGTIITGKPGSGKTFLALTLTTICSILGKTTIVLDPKGDFISLMSLKDEIGDINFWNLSDPKKKGILDPFYMASDKGEQLNLVISVIDMLVGGIKDEQFTVLSPIVKDVIESDVPSLLAVTEALLMSDKDEARNLGASLDLIRRLPFASLCFAPGNRRRATLKLDSGLTVVTMVGLELKSNIGNISRLSATVFFLITDFIRRIMHHDESQNPKTLIIDEAWAVLASSAGADCIEAAARLGRSKALALVLITQNDRDLGNLNIKNTITTRFAFNTDPKEATQIVEGMQLPPGEGFESALTSLNPGECLMRDWMGRYSTIHVSDWKEKWTTAFETNPLEKMRAERRRKMAEAKQQDSVSNN